MIDTAPRSLSPAQLVTLRDLAAIVIAGFEARRTNQQMAVEIDRVALRTAQLEAANDEPDAFLYCVSHDLRAPLRHISGFAEMLAEKVEKTLDAEGAHYLRTISRAAGSMGMLIEDLLSFSRMGRAERGHRAVDLGALTSEVVRGLEPDPQGRKMVWNIDDLPKGIGDYNLLRQVMINLLSTAVKYTRPRDPAVIEVAGSRDAARRSCTSATMAWATMKRMPAGYSGCFSGCMARTNSKGRGSAWPTYAGSSSGTAARLGPRVRSIGGQRFFSHCPRNPSGRPQIERGTSIEHRSMIGFRAGFQSERAQKFEAATLTVTRPQQLATRFFGFAALMDDELQAPRLQKAFSGCLEFAESACRQL